MTPTSYPKRGLRPLARPLRSFWLLWLASAACGSSPEGPCSDVGATGPHMRPGWDCLRCHADGKEEHIRCGAPIWSAAGTILSRQRRPHEPGSRGRHRHPEGCQRQ